MDPIHKLTEEFSHFPGIGPRQAKRFAYYLLGKSPLFLKQFADTIKKLKEEVAPCSICQRYFETNNVKSLACPICSDTTRNETLLMLVSRDVDLETIEKSHSYRGYYFVLGGSIPILEKEPEKKVRIQKLKERLKHGGEKGTLKEIIMALNATPEGDNTAFWLRRQIEPLVKQYALSVTMLGKGLSTGSELEYSDPETIGEALKNRTDR